MKQLALSLLGAVFLIGPRMACLHAQDLLRITEFMAENDGPLADEDGEFSDWIEIHNAGTNVVNLGGWYLTDRASQLTQWRFPNTNLAPNAYLIVFASGKDRRVAGQTLHTNFRLNNGGEYLGLTRPDGTNVVSAYAPQFPAQVSEVSYGLPVEQTVTTLLASGATARVWVPLDDSLGTAWTGLSFDDSGWLEAPSGLGYEADGRDPFVPVTLADSVAEFSGTQGAGNWFYGYWDRKSDGDGIYADSEFIPFPANYWTGTRWDWPGGGAPRTELWGDGGLPSGENGNPGNPSHWVVRRYVSELAGPVRLTGRVTHTNGWLYVTETGLATSSPIYIYHTGVGEGYIDDIKLVAGSTPEAGPNLIQNGSFESALSGPWTVSPNLSGSAISTSVKRIGNASLRLVSSAGGTTRESSIWQTVGGLTANARYTLSYWYLPGTNSAPLVVRFSGGWIETMPSFCGDGVLARIFVDGQQVYQQRALVSSVVYDLTVPVNAGSRIDFALDPGAADSDECDPATFTARVETANPATTIVADSAADWSTAGVQGEKNWFYGYYNRSADPNRTYQAADFTPFPRSSGPSSPSNFWDEEEWDWFSGDPPFDKIGQYWMVPNGTNNGAEHWVIRRWVSEVSGTLSLQWAAFKELPDQNNPGGGGVTVRIFHNGAPRDSAVVAGGDVFGVNRTVTLNNVQVGDTIDIALDPTNVDGRPHDDTDRTFVTAVIRGLPSLASQITTDLEGVMRHVNATAYFRFPFMVDDPSQFNSLTLRLKHDDGFIAYLNGVEVARNNAPLLADYLSQASAARSDAEASEYEECNLGSSLGLLRAGVNVLAIHGLNAAPDDSDFLILPELLATRATYIPSSGRYFSTPTPGAANGVGNTNLGPLILNATHTPAVPKDNETLTVTASVAPTFNAVGSVRLIYRVMFSNEVSAPMFDDGQHGDGAAGDGTWGGSIPASASNPGQMVRYYVSASDTRTNSGRFPAYEDPKNSPQYQGTVVVNPGLTNPLPVLHFFVQNPTLATNYTGTRCSVFWDGEFFDNIEVNAHGQTTWFVFPKRSMDFNLNTGHKLQWKRGESRIKAFDLLSTYGDKAYMRLVMAFEIFRDAGVPTHFAFPVRVQQNNAFHSVTHFVEQANDDFLERNGLNPTGSLYKIYFPLTNAYAGVKKETRKNEPNDDLQALIDGLNQSGAALRQFLFDHVDVPEAVNFFATIELAQNEDCCFYKNYYLHRDTGGTGQWTILPWDLDLTLGRTFTPWVVVGGNIMGGYFDTNIFWTNRWFSEQRALYDFIGVGQPIANALFSFPDTSEMFFRRWSTVQEEFLQKSSTHPLLLKFERRVDDLATLMQADAALDLAQWGTWTPFQTMPQAATILKSEYFARRRGWIFNTLAFANGGPYLGTQPTNAVIHFGEIEFNPASGNQAQEYIQIINPNPYAVDISGWKITGAIEHTFKPGTVLPPSGGALYLSPDVVAFRTRPSAPRGGQGLFVQGNYTGQLSARGEMLQLTDKSGRLVRSTNYSGAPSLAQQYLRVTELMYHPAAPPPGSGSDPEQFEYIELKNIGPVTLDLAGVRFVSGIEFDFTGSSVTSLGAGQSVLVVRNAAAFASRYGGGFRIAGQYSGALDNAGENLRLNDATGEKILDFDYDNKWYPITDGFGQSLVIVNATAPWNTWGQKASWRPSSGASGSPGQDDPNPLAPPPVLISELLSHPPPTGYDRIELHNPTGGNADISGWFLTDDFRTPKKFRIPNGTIIPGHGYWVFLEPAFNPTNPPTPTSFAFSSRGDEAYLFSADGAGNLTGYYHGFEFGAAEQEVTFGRYVNLVGQEFFVAQNNSTLGFENSLPRVGPVVLSEIMFHPPDLPDGTDNAEDEFIELRNLTGQPLAMFDPANPTNTWRVRGGVEFDFQTNTMLTGWLLIAGFDPSDTARLNAFRARYGVPASVPIYGPLRGKLDNSADSVQLYKPGPPVAGEVPYILVEAYDYDETSVYPGSADGTGASLHRLDWSSFGNEPYNWWPAGPGPGQDFNLGDPPLITTQPASRSVLAFSSATLTVAASGTAPLRYQWRLNGRNIPGATNASYTVSSVPLFDQLVYSAVVLNSAGSAVSSNAVLTVLLPIVILEQPTNQSVRVGFSATFRVNAVGSSPLSYQWRFNGTPISGATSATYVLSSAQPTNAGAYSVAVTDINGTVFSSNAILTVLTRPTITLQPMNQIVPEGGSATFSIAASGTPPISFRWRRGGITFTGGLVINGPTNSTLTLANVSFSDSTNYNVAVTNLAGQSPASSNAWLFVLIDSDGDGLPDDWEASQPGFNADEPSDGLADWDGDTMSNTAEYIAGTDYLDPASYLKAEILASGQATVWFNAVSNRTYSVQYTDGLNPPEWLKLGDVLAQTNSRPEVLIDSSPGRNRFYRLVTPVQP
jgi:hypothetical protein